MNFIEQWWGRFRDASFRWVQDDERDIGLLVFERILFLKYKRSTLISWVDGSKYQNAEKYVKAPLEPIAE